MDSITRVLLTAHRREYPCEVSTWQRRKEPHIQPDDVHALGIEDFCHYPDPKNQCVIWLFRTRAEAETFIKWLPHARARSMSPPCKTLLSGKTNTPNAR